MDVLFTPWRFQYLTAPKSKTPPACIFCEAAKSNEAREAFMLFRGNNALVMLNRYPYTNGHLMIAPTSHEDRLFASSDDSLRDLIRLTAQSQRILSEVYHPDGFNIGMNFGQTAGAGFADHYHVHIVPRWNGDANFMTVTAQTRLVPEELDATFDKLQPHFDQLSRGMAQPR